MNAKVFLAALTASVLVLCACSPEVAATTNPNPPPTQASSPTSRPEPPTITVPNPTTTAVPPTETAAPTATATDVPTPTIEPSPTPENQIFRDDFAGALQPGWTWENENSDRWTFTDDGRLQILAEDASLLGEQEQANLLWRDLPEGNFAVTVHLDAKTTTNFQQAAIFIYEDIDNYITINRGYCGICQTGGSGIYMDYKISGQLGTYMVPMEASDVYIRLESKDNVITGSYATAPDQWQRLGRFGNYFQFKRVGLGASNCDMESDDNADLAAFYDYFEITRP